MPKLPIGKAGALGNVDVVRKTEPPALRHKYTQSPRVLQSIDVGP